MLKKIPLALALCLPLICRGVDYRVTATAVDSAGVAEMFATWRVFAQSDSIKPVAGAVTGEDGIISATLPSEGSYTLSITGMEGARASVPFELAESRPTIDLGKVALTTTANQLAELTVTAQKPLVTKEIDRIGYDVAADEEAKTSPVADILRKVPLVSVDAEGNIKVNGSSDFRIYKNGRPNNTLTSNAKEIFKSLPASSIKKIEVITDPGAREDAEGVGAILNIVTDSQTAMKGVMGSATINANNRSPIPMPYLWLTTQVGKVTASVNGSINYNPRNANKSDSETESHYANTGNIQHAYSSSQSQNKLAFGSIEASWEPDTMNLVTFEAGGFGFISKSWSTNSNSMSDALGNLLYGYDMISNGNRSTSSSMDFGANYQHNTRLKDETITLSYRLSHQISDSYTDAHYENAFNLPVPYDGTYSNGKSRFYEHTIQIDWARPLGKHIKGDFGAKYIRRISHSKSDNKYYGAPQMDAYTDFVHSTDVMGAYADLRGKWGNFSARAGFRYEYSHMQSEYKKGGDDNFGVSLNDWIPNLSVSWTATPASTLKFTVNRRISRPGMWALNPAINQSVNSVSQGNPDLHSQTKNSVQFNYNLIARKFNLDANMYYRFSTDAIAPTQRVEGDRVYSSYANCGHERSLSASVWAQWSPGSKTQLGMRFGWSLDTYKYPHDNISLTRPQYSTNLNISQKLPCKFSLMAYGGWWSGWMSGVYGYSKSLTDGLYYGLRLQRSFLREDRLTVGVSVAKPFMNHTHSISYRVNSDFTSRTVNNRYTNTRFNLSVSLRFGSLQAYVKKTKGTISNDDLSSGGSGQPSAGN